MRIRNLAIILLIFIFLVLIYYANRRLQQLVQPRRSFGRLLIYLLVCLTLAFGCSFLLVLIIANLFPAAKG